MATLNLDAIRRRLSGVQDPRGLICQFSRGSNIYRGGLPNAVSGPQRMFSTNPVGPGPNAMPTQTYTPPPAQNPAGPYSFPSVNVADVPWGELPFDQYYEANIRRLQGQEAGLGSEEEIARRRLQEGYSSQGEDLQRGHLDTLRSLAQSMADRGLIHSGINIGEQGREGEDYLRGVSSLEQSNARSLEDIARDFAAQRQSLTAERTSLDEQRARDLMQLRLEEARKQAESEAAKMFAAQYQTTPTGQIIPTQNQAPVAGGATPTPSRLIAARRLTSSWGR